MAIVYKLTADGSAIQMSEDGHPIVTDDKDDKEFPIRATELYSKIPALQLESKTHREEKQALQKRIEAFGNHKPEDILERLAAFGDIDPVKAREALITVSNLGELDKEKNIEIEKVKAGVADGYKEKIKAIDAGIVQERHAFQDSLAQKDHVIRNLLIKGAFDRSEFIKEQTVLTPDIAYDSFGKYFRIEEDGDSVKVFGMNRSGDKFISKANPTEYASPEEAIELIINEYPQKDNILRTNSGGSGAGGNVSQSSSKKATREALMKMNPAERLNALRR